MRRSDRAYIGFSCDLELKKRALSLAKRSGSVSLGSVCRLALKRYLHRKEHSLNSSEEG